MEICEIESRRPAVLINHFSLISPSHPSDIKYSKYTMIYHNGEYLVFGEGVNIRGMGLRLHSEDHGDLVRRLIMEKKMETTPLLGFKF